MKKRIISLLLAAISLLNLAPFSILPAVAEEGMAEAPSVQEETLETEEGYIKGLVTVACNGGDAVTLEKGEKIYAFATPAEELGENVTYSWQLKSRSGRWGTIGGYVFPFAAISDALLSNAITEDGTAKLRCVVETDGKKFVSNVLSVSLPWRVLGQESEESEEIEEIEEIEEAEALEPVSVFSLRSVSAESDVALAAEEPEATEAEETEAEVTEAEETEAEVTDPEVTEAEETEDEELEDEELEDEDPGSLMGGSSSSAADAFQIVINYTYRHATAAKMLELDTSLAANTFTVTLPAGGYYTGTVATPPEVGYLPYVMLAQESYVTGYVPLTDEQIKNGEKPFPESYYVEYDGKQYVLANSIQFNNQIDDITVQVYFIPQKVTFRVKVYEQNLYDDEYVLAETISYSRIANEEVGKGYDLERRGFSSLYYDPSLPISEDGSYAIDIYYDRIYYLVDFELNDNGEAFGAPNSYVRYKTPVVLPTPTRPGYSFINWTLDLVSDDQSQPVNDHTYSTTAAGGYLISSTEHNLNYSASWKTETTSYTVIYWLENPDDPYFTLDSFKVVEGVTPGASVSAKNDYAGTDAKYFTFNETLSDKNVTVAADGTTAVNAYYLRNYYTMTFSGDTKCITPEHTHDENCPKGTCDLTPHTHTMECVEGEDICGKEEHIHVDSCCSLTEHAHDSICCDVAYHVHDVINYSDCIKTEHKIHHMECYSRNALATAESLSGDPKTAYNNLKSAVTGPVDGNVYRIRAKNNGTIFNFIHIHGEWFFLGQGSDYNGVTYTGTIRDYSVTKSKAGSAQAKTICGLELHTHGDGSCACDKEEHDHTSGCSCSVPRHVHGEGECAYTVCEKEYHKHGITCYTYRCGMQSHTHTADCVRKCQMIEHTHGTCDDNTNTKNFLQIKRKYDADISKVWPALWELFPNGERWKANTYFSEVLVYLPFMPPANITFSKNEGTANKLYNISYYLESLDTTAVTYQNRYFDLNNKVNAKYSYLTKAEDFFDIRGFTQLGSNPAFSGNQISTNSDGAVSLYYSRNDYDLEFVSLGTTLSRFAKTLKYQQPIGESFEPRAEDIPYPSNEEPGAIQFVGWYTTPNCADGTEFVFDGNTIMPIGGLVLYAKWETCSYTVNVYSDVQKTEMVRPYPQTVLFGSYIAEPNHANLKNENVTQDPNDPDKPLPPSYDEETKMIFAGWYYMDGATEKRFDFNTMPVKSNMDIYAKWTSRIPVNYTVRYVYHDGEKYVDIAKATTGASLAGITKTFVAKVGSDLDSDYDTGYFPEMRAHSMTMSSNAAENEYLFVYTIPQTVTYTVTHKFSDPRLAEVLGEGNTTLTESFTHTIEGEDVATSAAFVVVSFREGLTKDVLAQAVKDEYGITLESEQKTKLWEIITDLSPDYFLQNLKLTTNAAANDAPFLWEKNDGKARYQIIYYIESIDGSEYTVYSTQTNIASAGTPVTAEQINIEYFELDTTHPDTILSGTVVDITEDTSTGGLNKGLVMRLYYKRQLYSYTVYHYKQGTNVSLVEGEPVTKQAKYQETIRIADEAVDINGYTLVNGSDTVTISANNEQTVECFYQGLEVYYQYQVRGVGGTIGNPTDTVAIGGDAPASKTLELWSDGFFLHAWYYSIDDGEEKPVESEWLSNGDMTVTLPPPEVDLAGKTVYVFAEVLPTTRRFSVEGFTSPENDPQAFVFRLKGAGKSTANVDVTFIIFDNGYTDVALLPYGEYTLTTLHWAWRYGTPTSVTFGGATMDASSGTVELNLSTTGDVIITYPSEIKEKWLTDDASGIVLLGEEHRLQ